MATITWEGFQKEPTESLNVKLRTDHRSEFETFLQRTIQETTGETHTSDIPSGTGRVYNT